MHPGPALFMPVYGGTHVCTNGPVWSAVTSPTSDQWTGLVQYGSTWVATGASQAGSTPSNSIFSTNAGVSWTPGGTLPNLSNHPPFSLRAGAHNGTMIAYGQFGTSWLTANLGATWSTFPPGASFSCSAVESGNGLFVYVDNVGAQTYSSPTGAGVSTHATPALLSRCWWNPNRSLWLGFESAGTRSWTSPDLVTWTAGPAMPFNSSGISPYGISQNGSNIVIVYADPTSQNAAYSLNDGLTFASSATFPGVSQSYSVVHGNGLVLCTIGAGSIILISSDFGANWTAGNSNTTTKTWQVGYDGTNGWLAVGGSGTADTILNVGIC